MRVLIAPDSFKESMTAAQAAGAIARGIRSALKNNVEIDLCPMADGGEGTLDALLAATRGSRHTGWAFGPLGQRLQADWGMLGDGTTAVIEMAQTAGLHLVPLGQRDPTKTTTMGVALQIVEAIRAGATKIIVAIGGSATNDGGVCMACLLGVAFFDRKDRLMTKPLPTGGTLHTIGRIDFNMGRDDLRETLARTQVLVACDVTNPLYGPNGAAAVYAPQKGATQEQVKVLDDGLRHLASLVPHVDPSAPGMGAAGGMGFGLVAFCGARLVRGIELVMEAVRFDDRVRGCDLVITGEGRLDGQSIRGKTCIGLAQAAARQGVRTIALVGSVGPGAELALRHGFSAYDSIVGQPGGPTVEQAMAHGPELLEKLAAKAIARDLTCTDP